MTKNSRIAVLITAAGSSTRMGSSTKKEYLPYNNGTVLTGCAKTFLKTFYNNYNYLLTDFIITCPKGGKELCSRVLNEDSEFSLLLKKFSLEKGINIVEGGTSRQQSVFNGIKAVHNNPDIILIHDGARPFVTSKLILDGIDSCLKNGASVPGLTPTETQKRIDKNGFIVEHLVRSSLSSVQTPQCFDYKKLFAAHKKASEDNFEYTDDTEIWGKYYPENPVKVYSGDVNNIKITYPADLIKLENK